MGIAAFGYPFFDAVTFVFQHAIVEIVVWYGRLPSVLLPNLSDICRRILPQVVLISTQRMRV